MGFLEKLKKFNKDDIQPTIMANIRANFIGQPLFHPEKVSKASSAAEGLCRWILAMEQYDLVAQVIKPKKERLRTAEEELKKTMEMVTAKKAEIKILHDELMEKEAQLQEVTRKRQKLEWDMEMCKTKLERAEKLIGERQS